MNPAGSRDFCLLQNIHTCSGVHSVGWKLLHWVWSEWNMRLSIHFHVVAGLRISELYVYLYVFMACTGTTLCLFTFEYGNFVIRLLFYVGVKLSVSYWGKNIGRGCWGRHSKTHEVGYPFKSPTCHSWPHFAEPANSYDLIHGHCSTTWPPVYLGSWPQFHIYGCALYVSSASLC